MKRSIGYVFAAAMALAIAAPTLASAQTTVIKRGHDRDYSARAEMRGHRDRGWHRHHHDRKVVVIRRGHRHHH
ncbi:hypothetical protein [Bradyrhizobium prioriisuperbiae]|uniref:hypothetical protein n=1 Tax=Bradyrhizobium prioriisuperbiae TaxID=2854389 RepID=UPI0028E6F175|nr:hypothetical protein [Bradyrhizobium prioritasuperba]